MKSFRPTDAMLDDPELYSGIHESLRQHRRPGDPIPVALCFECMNVPRSDRSKGGVRCIHCDGRRTKRMRGASEARGA